MEDVKMVCRRENGNRFYWKWDFGDLNVKEGLGIENWIFQKFVLKACMQVWTVKVGLGRMAMQNEVIHVGLGYNWNYFAGASDACSCHPWFLHWDQYPFLLPNIPGQLTKLVTLTLHENERYVETHCQWDSLLFQKVSFSFSFNCFKEHSSVTIGDYASSRPLFLLRIRFACRGLCLFKVDLNLSWFRTNQLSLGSNDKNISYLRRENSRSFK